MENRRGYRDDMLLFHAIIQKNINFLRRSSKKYDFIIENIFEEVNIIDDIKIIVDCGLLMDMTVTNVLVATDLLILPVKVGGFEVEAIANRAEQVEDLRGMNENIRIKVLMTMRQKNQTSLQVEQWLKESSGQECFETSVRRSIVAEKATMQRVPLPVFSKSCIVTRDYREVTREILEEMEE